MGLTEHQATELIKRLESEAKAAPRRYELRVILLGFLGYAYVFGVALGLVLILYLLGLAFVSGSKVGYVIGKIGWLVIGLLYIIVRALWVKFPHPSGIQLTAAESPRLFQLIDDLIAKMRAPRAHAVLLTNDFNAAVTQVPRFSFFGWPKNYLILGLPLMAALTTPQFTAVVAHELGHISGQHGRFLAWIYRIRATWYQLMALLEQQQHIGALAFRKFVEWYAPYFNAYSFVLARNHELQADRRAAETTNEKIAAEALMSVAVLGQELDHRFWPAVYRQADSQPKPAAEPYLALVRDPEDRVANDDAKSWLREALALDTGYSDTHPCLRERLAALGQDPSAAADKPVPRIPSKSESAAAELLGEGLLSHAKQFDQEWRAAIAPSWKERFDEMQAAQARLRELASQASNGTLPPGLAWERISLCVRLDSPEAALPMARELLQQLPDHIAANYFLGQVLTDQGEAEGISYLNKAMAADADLMVPVHLLLFKYYTAAGQDGEAQAHLNKAEERQGILELARQERQHVGREDEFAAHGLSQKELRPIVEQLKTHSVRRAYLARKVTRLLPEKPLYVLAVEAKPSWLGLVRQKDTQALANQLATEVQLPGEIYVYVAGSRHDWLTRTLRRLDDGTIYERGQTG